mgnify:CR=1 FL=1
MMSFPIRLQNIFLSVYLISILKVTAQNNPSLLFQNWITAQQNNTEPVLPNFSYAGYHNGEIGIPNPSYRVFDVTDPTYGANPNDTVSSGLRLSPIAPRIVPLIPDIDFINAICFI